MSLLALWNLVYQAPLVAVITAAAFGQHEQLVTRVMEVLDPRRRALQTALAALLSEHVPWLRQLLLLR